MTAQQVVKSSDSSGPCCATQTETGDSLDVRSKSHCLREVHIKRRRADSGDRREKQVIDVGGLHASVVECPAGCGNRKWQSMFSKKLIGVSKVIDSPVRIDGHD